MIVDADFAIRVVIIYVMLESGETKLIAIFEIAIVRRIFLNRIVGQMNEGIIDVLKVDSKLSWGSPQVTFFKEVNVMILVEKNPYSNVKLPLAD